MQLRHACPSLQQQFPDLIFLVMSCSKHMLTEAKRLQQFFRVSQNKTKLTSVTEPEPQMLLPSQLHCLVMCHEQTHDVGNVMQVLEWSATQQLLPRAGRFASFPDWRTAVNKRSSAVQYLEPFLQDLLGSLTSGDASQVL